MPKWISKHSKHWNALVVYIFFSDFWHSKSFLWECFKWPETINSTSFSFRAVDCLKFAQQSITLYFLNNYSIQNANQIEKLHLGWLFVLAVCDRLKSWYSIKLKEKYVCEKDRSWIGPHMHGNRHISHFWMNYKHYMSDDVFCFAVERAVQL